MSDQRIPIQKGSRIVFNSGEYTIKTAIGYGGSCLAYSAEREPSEYEHSIGMPPTPAVIKEFYPLELTDCISRTGGELRVTTDAEAVFNALKRRFENGTVNQAMFFVKDGDHSFAPTRITLMNGTVYAVVDSVQGDILTNVCGNLEMVEVAQVIQSLSYAAKALHDDERLHLDIKPSNIFLFNRDSSESRRVALFDFDTVTPISEIKTADIAFSEGWSPYEQVNQQRDKISFATDIYSIGAVFYWLMSDGEKVTDGVLSAIKRRRFDFIDKFPVLAGKQSPREGVIEFLSATLKREPLERAQKVEELLK